MPSIVCAESIFGEMFGSAKMRALFTDRSLVQRYLDVEAALARAEARLGIIPAEAARASDPSTRRTTLHLGGGCSWTVLSLGCDHTRHSWIPQMLLQFRDALWLIGSNDP